MNNEQRQRMRMNRLLKDPVALIKSLWTQNRLGRIEIGVVATLAASRDFARAATPHSVAKLIELANTTIGRLGERGFELPGILALHVDTLNEMGMYSLASAMSDGLMPHFQRFGQPLQIADFYTARAIIRATLGAPDTVDMFDRAMALYAQHGTPSQYAQCLFDRSSALREAGRYVEALAGYDEALKTLKTDAPPGAMATYAVNRAIVLELLGRYAEAAADYQALLPELDRYGSRSEFARALQNYGCLLYAQKNPIAAAAVHTTAVPLLKTHCDVGSYARGLTNWANALTELGSYTEAIALLETALPIIKRSTLHDLYFLTLTNLGNALQGAKRLPEALAVYQAAFPEVKKSAPRVIYSRTVTNWANLLITMGRFSDAVRAIDGVLADNPSDVSPLSLALSHAKRADALRHLGRLTEAVAGYAESRKAVRRARRIASTDDTALEMPAWFTAVYIGSVATGLDAGLTDDTYDAVREGKAGVFDDIAFKLKRARGAEPQTVLTARNELTQWLRTQAPQLPDNAELTESEVQQLRANIVRFNEGCDERTKRYLSEWGQHANAYDASRNVVPTVEDLPTRAEVQKELQERWALIDFWQTDKDEFHAFVLTRDDFRVVTLPFPFDATVGALNRTIRELRQTATATAPGLEGLNELGTLLFRPLLPMLREKGIEGLYLVPHGFLHRLPLHAARWFEKGALKYLCDEFAIAYLPSANLLPRLPKPDPTGGTFVLANPEVGTRHTLPFSMWEGRQMCELFDVPPDKFFLGGDGTLAATDAWADCGLVHFSCHGSADDQFAPLSHLRLADDLLLGHDVLHRKPQLRDGAVVLLNACQTGALDLRAVNEGQGLAAPFLSRGASVVFSTQWSVLDLCAAPMVLTFAEQMRGGATPAAAMKTAQTLLRQTSLRAMLNRMKDVEGTFEPGTPEWAQVMAQRAWLCLRGGLHDEARTAATRAASPLRAAGLDAQAALLVARTTEAAQNNAPAWIQNFDNPVFWGAFQLVGRVV